jgi:hypothetical protein
VLLSSPDVANDLETPDLLAAALRVVTRTVATVQAVAELAADVGRQAVSASRTTDPVAAMADSPTPALPRSPAGVDAADAAALAELDNYLAERPYWSTGDAAARRRLELGVLIGAVATRAGRPLAAHELVGLAYHFEHTQRPPAGVRERQLPAA